MRWREAPRTIINMITTSITSVDTSMTSIIIIIMIAIRIAIITVYYYDDHYSSIILLMGAPEGQGGRQREDSLPKYHTGKGGISAITQTSLDLVYHKHNKCV